MSTINSNITKVVLSQVQEINDLPVERVLDVSQGNMDQEKGVQSGPRQAGTRLRAWRRSLRGCFTRLGDKVSKLAHSMKSKVKAWTRTVCGYFDRYNVVLTSICLVIFIFYMFMWILFMGFGDIFGILAYLIVYGIMTFILHQI